MEDDVDTIVFKNYKKSYSHKSILIFYVFLIKRRKIILYLTK